ncbi:MAG: hypothetical protein LBV51_03545 [Acholeplasmatales bacterium]|jgi:hypothetical protein|nr:hypothetical protein [Acholeplasmatales bacterium]
MKKIIKIVSIMVGLLFILINMSSCTKETVTITFKNYDGTVIDSYSINKGSNAVYDNTVLPSRNSTQEYSYVFIGWDRSLKNIKEDTIFNPVFNNVKRTYTIKFVNYDGTILQQTVQEFGEDTVYYGDTPIREATGETSYSFLGWDMSLSSVAENTTYTAVYYSNVKMYLIQFLNYNGDIYESINYKYGDTPVYGAAIPSKTSTVMYNYRFVGWDPQITAVTGEAVYTAVFEEVIRKYSITFNSYIGGTTYLVEYGVLPVYTGPTPTRSSTQDFTYTFAGWDKEIVIVTTNATYNALFTQSPRFYTIIFLNYNGALLQSSQVQYGVLPSYNGVLPQKESTVQEDFHFNGWDKQIVKVYSNTSYTAQYIASPRSYSIYFRNYDNTLLAEYLFQYGSIPSYSGVSPSKPSNAEFSFVWNGWNPSLTAVTGEATYTAKYSEVIREYTIIFIIDSFIVQSSSLPYGDTPIYNGTTPSKEGTPDGYYEFIGWSPEIEIVTNNAVYTAVFEFIDTPEVPLGRNKGINTLNLTSALVYKEQIYFINKKEAL